MTWVFLVCKFRLEMRRGSPIERDTFDDDFWRLKAQINALLSNETPKMTLRNLLDKVGDKLHRHLPGPLLRSTFQQCASHHAVSRVQAVSKRATDYRASVLRCEHHE